MNYKTPKNISSVDYDIVRYQETISSLEDAIKAHEKGKNDFCKRLGCCTLHQVETKFRDLEKELAVYKKVLENMTKIAVGNDKLNCSFVSCVDECKCGDYCLHIEEVINKYVDQARKELEEKDEN